MEKKDTAPSAAGKAREENAAIAYRRVKANLHIYVLTKFSISCVQICNISQVHCVHNFTVVILQLHLCWVCDLLYFTLFNE